MRAIGLYILSVTVFVMIYLSLKTMMTFLVTF